MRIGPKLAQDIGWAEAVAVELGLQMVIVLNLARPGPFLVRSDNKGVVAVINKGRSRSAATNLVLQHIYAQLARQGMYLQASYVSTHKNIADALSRGDTASFLRSFPAASTQLNITLPSHLAHFLIPL